MSIATAITNLQGKIANAYTAIENKGGTLPATQDAQNLSASIDSIPSGGGFEGYTFTIANNYHQDTESYYASSCPIILHYVDGTSETIDISNGNAANIRGITRENVRYVEGGIWTTDEADFRGWLGYLVSSFENTGIPDSGYISQVWFQIENDGKRQLFPRFDGNGIIYLNLYSWNTLPLIGNAVLTHSGSGVRCYLKGTLITLADGKQKPVEEITYNDNLLVWDFDRGCLATAKPLWIKKAAKAPYYFKNTLASGKILLTTGQSKTGWGHRMFDIDKGAFRYTTETVSDSIFTLDGPEMHKSCERVEEECEYYNIITDFHMNLFANRILTSCSYNNLYPIKDMKFVKDGRELRPFEAYDVPLEYYKGLRLSEQTIDASDTNQYVMNLIEDAVSR